MELNDIHNVYFIGIGGIGMSALARFFLQQGMEVSGYDRTSTALTQALQSEGMSIHFNDDPTLVPEGVDLVIYTPAVPDTHAELNQLRKMGVPIMKRSEALGLISRNKKTVAVGGTHGKTTTSSMTAYVLQCGGIDCSAFLGGIARNFESNYTGGTSEWVVVEADEYDRSFLRLTPDIAVILSMDPDHLEIYGDGQNMIETGYKAFLQRIKPGGKALVNAKIAPQLKDQSDLLTFGLQPSDYFAENIQVKDGHFVFDLVCPGQIIPGLSLAMPGRHNVENAVAASAVALLLGVAPQDLAYALRTFKGIKRRFDIITRVGKKVLIDDYAHHPTEIKAAAEAARELYPGKKITAVFQPHLFSRTHDFSAGFAQALDLFDQVFLLEIYPARELPMPGVDSGIIFDQMNLEKKVRCTKVELMDKLQSTELEVLMTLGAGDIDTLVEPLRNFLEQE